MGVLAAAATAIAISTVISTTLTAIAIAYCCFTL